MTSDVITRIEMPTLEIELDGRLKLLKRLFTFTFLIFRDGTDNRIFKIRLFMAILLTTACKF
jgi:hypothetical protein